VRRWICVPMMALCLLLTGCGGETSQKQASAARKPYQDMTGCKMEAAVTCGTGSEDALTFTLSCDYAPEGETTVEVLSPDTVAGVKAVLTGDQLKLQYEDLCLDAGTLSDEEVSPLMCPARLMSALRSGWLLEQNEEKVGEIPCLRLCMDQTTDSGEKILSTVWLQKDGNTPVCGEIAVGDEIIFHVEFTSFSFYDILQNNETGN